MANNSIRIRTTPGSSKNIRIKLEQDFDFLEILSLKITQEDLYQTFCSDYGVVVGRVIANKGFGVPNAKVSIFIPISDEDKKNVLIKDFYPYRTPYQKNAEGYRYNLLLSKNSCFLNKPTGSFPTKEHVLDNDIILEVFDKYYKYTTKTNDSGDFMIFGVPIGQHTAHMDVDLSDARSISLRPYDLIADGYPEKLFESKTQFKTSSNLDSLAQIKSSNIGIDVIPFWGDPENCEIGITRVDFDTNFDIKTTALFFGSIFTDSGKMSLNMGCNPKNDQGEQDNFKTSEGQIQIIRVNEYDTDAWVNQSDVVPTNLEKFDVNGGDLIDSDGTFAFPLPLNLGHSITNEYGEIVPSPDPSVGIATKGMYRFKMKFTQPNQNPKSRTASMLFPSLSEDFGGTRGYVDTGDISRINGTQDQRFTDDITQYTNYPNSRIKMDFHTFEWKQLYTIAHYIKKYKKGPNRFSFLGLKNTDVSGSSNFFPYNNTIWKFDLIYNLFAFFIDAQAAFIKLLISIISFCLYICLVIEIPRICILKACVGPWRLLSICKQICPFAFLGGVIGEFKLPCEGAPNDEYVIPPGGDWSYCNPSGCGGEVVCDCTPTCSVFDIGTTGADSSGGICLDLLENWKCCTKLNLAESRNVMRRVFTDSWVFGTAYLFQFKYKKKIKKSTGEVKKEKFCGPGSDNGRGDNYKKNDCCPDSPNGNSCDKCLIRGPGITKTRGQFRYYHENWHNEATNRKQTGAVDTEDLIYCNVTSPTKIVSLGHIEMCQETLESIQNATIVNQALKKYTQSADFYTGTFFENGWDDNFWVDFLRETSYEDPRDIFFYLGKKVNCQYRQLFDNENSCHEYELIDDGYFLIKEASKIQNTVELGGATLVDEEQFSPTNENNPYYDYINADTPTYGGFSVDLGLANKFSPCGNGGQCVGQPNDKWTNDGTNPEDDEANSNSWDNINQRFARNNKNTRSNIPYYYFGINPGKTAINKLKKEYFVIK